MVVVRTVAIFQAAPAPACGDAQQAFGQGAQIVSHLLHGESPLDIACQRAKDLCVVGTAQQIEQRFVIVFGAALQGRQSTLQFLLEIDGIKAFVQHGIAGQLINDAGMLEQVACGPAGRTQHAQQALVHVGAFQQQGQIALAPQQRLNPVGQPHCGLLGDLALGEPLRGAQNQST